MDVVEDCWKEKQGLNKQSISKIQGHYKTRRLEVQAAKQAADSCLSGTRIKSATKASAFKNLDNTAYSTSVPLLI